jgi:hypothetical protein
MAQAGSAFGLGMSLRGLRKLLTIALFGVLGAGCTTHYIPNTDVEDTDDNRRIIDFCEQYRHAVENRNIPKLLQLADSRYYEDGGNADSSDDLDFDGLKEYLEGQFKQTRAIRYEIHYRRVSEGRKKTLFVDYTYTASYKIPSPTGDLWRRRVADNRLEIMPQGESFKILAGM